MSAHGNRHRSRDVINLSVRLESDARLQDRVAVERVEERHQPEDLLERFRAARPEAGLSLFPA